MLLIEDLQGACYFSDERKAGDSEASLARSDHRSGVVYDVREFCVNFPSGVA